VEWNGCVCYTINKMSGEECSAWYYGVSEKPWLFCPRQLHIYTWKTATLVPLWQCISTITRSLCPHTVSCFCWDITHHYNLCVVCMSYLTKLQDCITSVGFVLELCSSSHVSHIRVLIKRWGGFHTCSVVGKWTKMFWQSWGKHLCFLAHSQKNKQA